jgi:ACS family tartrate transporter-like MFS transporter
MKRESAIREEAVESALERKTMRQIYLRLLPFCFILYFICYLDRVNIGFAALTMNRDLGLSSYVFGIGAGAFFWGISCWRCRAT